jgi:NTP pyrophosphatase (non-canonical NTP hydrolase)
MQNHETFGHLQEELADVFWYLCRICEHFDIDISKAVENKAELNAKKYPIKG